MTAWHLDEVQYGCFMCSLLIALHVSCMLLKPIFHHIILPSFTFEIPISSMKSNIALTDTIECTKGLLICSKGTGRSDLLWITHGDRHNEHLPL